MKPIEINVIAQSSKTPEQLCEEFLDTNRWSEFAGYFVLPGVKKAVYEVKTPGEVGSRIRVYNTDGSWHVEEIIVWDAPDQIAVQFQEFKPPLANLATHFIETWAFRRTPGGTQITRTMRMYPKSRWGQLALRPIGFLMKKAFEKHLRHG